jgi:5'-nucleotidase
MSVSDQTDQPQAADEPNILVVNDDGWGREGIDQLRQASSKLGTVWTVAPDSEQSGTGHALSLREPIRVNQIHERTWTVSGSPSDCVYLALYELMEEPPDLCLAGVNHGSNLADDVLYSGTVAAAVEATLCDVPSVAVSVTSRSASNYDVAAEVAVDFGRDVLDRGLPREVLLNINVPSEAGADAPVEVAKLGRRNYRRDVTEKRDPYDRPYYWLGGSELTHDDMPGSDCNAVAEGAISVTPLEIDMTRHAFETELGSWRAVGDSSDRPQSDEPGSKG